MNRLLAVSLFSIVAMSARPALVAAPFLYQTDDGTQDSRVAPSVGTTKYWIERYTVLAGAELILGVEMRWGAESVPVDAELFVWTDPDNDGNLSNLVLRRTVATTVSVPANLNNLPVVDYLFDSPVLLPVGSQFFVGARSSRITAVPLIWLAAENNTPISGLNYEVNFSGVHTGGSLTGGGISAPFLADRGIRAIAAPSLVSQYQKDTAIDFGTESGVWLLSGTTTWSQLNPISPESMVRGDLDGNGLDDLVIDFGSSPGVWVWMNHITWIQLNVLSPSHMVTGDLDGNGRDEVILDFPGVGIWIWSNNTSWSQLHGLNAAYLATGDLDNTGSADVIIDFPGRGIWIYANNSRWTQLHPLNGMMILTADLDGSGHDDVVIDFPGFGLWGYYNNTSWGQIHPFSASHVAAGDFDGNGSAELAIDFGPVYGLWLLANNSNWTSLNPLAAEEIAFADRNADGRDEILINFGAPYGLWQYANPASWTQLHLVSPESMVSGRFH